MAEASLREAIADMAGALLPLHARELQRDLEDRLEQLPNAINEYGFDPYGLSLEWVRSIALPGMLLYRYYFRAETFGIENVPAGRALVIANHAGQLPFDAVVLSMALLLEAAPPRLARSMAEYWVSQLPSVSVFAARAGTLVGTPENCVHMLENEECVVTFPEGVRGMNKLYSDRYELQRFGLGFMRLALQTNTPIVPVGIVGSEEQQPGLLNLKRVAKALGVPALPITATFPLLGPLGLLPLPVKYRLHFGKPMHFEGDPNDEDTQIQAKVDSVKSAISGLLKKGVRDRSGVFR